MRPIHIVILMLAGALGGAALMKVVQKPTSAVARVQPVNADPVSVPATQTAATPATPVSAPVQATVSVPVTEAPAAPVTAPHVDPAPATSRATTRAAVIETDKPSPMKPKPSSVVREERAERTMARSVVAPPKRVLSAIAAKPAPATPEYRHTPAPVAVPEPAVPTSVPAAEPQHIAQQDPPAQSLPPARPEPEVVTPPPPPPPAPEPNRATLNAGTLIPVRLLDGLSSERNVPGDAFTATLDRELVAGGFVIAERGARVDGRVVNVDHGTRIKGGAALVIELTRLHTSDGQVVPIQTDSFQKVSEPDHRQDAEKVGVGAILGAVIGGIAGGGKGAAIGAGAGAGAGGADAVLTRKQAALPTETRLTFRVRAPLTLTERR